MSSLNVFKTLCLPLHYVFRKETSFSQNSWNVLIFFKGICAHILEILIYDKIMIELLLLRFEENNSKEIKNT